MEKLLSQGAQGASTRSAMTCRAAEKRWGRLSLCVNPKITVIHHPQGCGQELSPKHRGQGSQITANSAFFCTNRLLQSVVLDSGPPKAKRVEHRPLLGFSEDKSSSLLWANIRHGTKRFVSLRPALIKTKNQIKRLNLWLKRSLFRGHHSDCIFLVYLHVST